MFTLDLKKNKSELSLFESPALCGHTNVPPLLNTCLTCMEHYLHVQPMPI